MEDGEGMGMAAESCSDAAERREEERYAVGWDAEIFIPERTTMFRGRMVNLSPSGCYVQTVAWVRVPPTTVVELVFRLEGRWTRVRAEARFAQSRTGVGLRFLALEQEVRRRLDDVLGELRTGAVVAEPGEESGAGDAGVAGEAADQGLI